MAHICADVALETRLAVVCSHSNTGSSADAQVLSIQKQLETAVVVHKGRNVTLEDLCFKPIKGKGCLIECECTPARFWASGRPSHPLQPLVNAHSHARGGHVSYGDVVALVMPAVVQRRGSSG